MQPETDTGRQAITRNPIRIAVAGAGLIGRRHVEAIQQCGAAELAAVADPAPETAAYAAALGVACHQDIAAMLANARPDGVIVATPNQLHVEHGLLCIGAGVPVLVEKPIASDTASAERLVRASETAGVPVLVGHHRRHNPIIKAAKAKLSGGAIGEVVAVHGICWLYKPDDYFDTGWRRQAGAGPVFINLIHDIDLLRYLCGEVVSVQACESNRQRGHQVEETAVILLRFESGALATVTVSDSIVAPWSWELTAGENPAYPKTRESCYLIGGTHGSLELPGSKVWTNPAERSWWEPIDCDGYTVEEEDPLQVQIGHFCRVIAEGEQPVVSGAEGLRTLRVIEAIKSAAASGARVDLVGSG